MNGNNSTMYGSDDDYDDYPVSCIGKSAQNYSTAQAPSLPLPIPGLISGGAGLGGLGQIAGPSSAAFGSSYQQPSTSQNRAGAGNVCCLLDDARRCQRPAGNASYSKRVQKTVFYKRLRLDVDNQANHTYICDHHKSVIQNARVRARKDSEDDGNDDDSPEADLYQLQVNTLRRYKKHFKISTRPGLNKAQLAEILSKHFNVIPVNEKETLTCFIYAIKCGRNKSDNRQIEGGTTDFSDRY